METTLNHDYYLQFNETYFVSRGSKKKAVTNNNDKTVSYTQIRLFGRKLYNGILKTIADILVLASLLALCKYAGIYDLWIQVVEKLV